MEVVVARIAGLDVHKETVMACVRAREARYALPVGRVRGTLPIRSRSRGPGP